MKVYDMLIEPAPMCTINCHEDSFECGWKEAVDVSMLEIEAKMRSKDYD